MNQPQTTLADLFKESVIFQGVLAVMCIGGTFLLLLTGRAVPDYVWVIDASALGFFFGAKNLLTARNAASEATYAMQTVAEQNAAMAASMAQINAQRAQGRDNHAEPDSI